MKVFMIATGIQPQDVPDCTWTERLNLCKLGVIAGMIKH